ncbi:hypothetical protein [Streptomyces lateritius]|uniref:hypothetical protein n=1 Tax=Streptomyces lateritius TaxID=67313 RepID=UPI001C8C305E|nr:hypothetical protein [Streptomyces lateritius]MBX9426673.1 hypothetical protein [Streptomyces lateritius]
MSSRSPDESRLGVRPYDPGPGAGGEPEDPHELLHRARRLSALGHPRAGSAWERAATALRRAGGALAPGDHADALDATAFDCRGAARPAAGPLFFRAADLHERAGQRGKALVSRARALLAGLGHGPDAGGHAGHGLDAGYDRGPGPCSGATAVARIGELCERAAVLHALGQAGAVETATLRLLHGRARAALLDTAPDPVAEASALRAELTRLVEVTAPHPQDRAALGVRADARALLGRITAPDDPAAALTQLRAAIEDHRAAGRPWPATGHRLLLASVLRTSGAPEEAAALLRAALASDERDAPLRAGDRARLCLALARTVAGSGPEAADEEMALLAEAVDRADGPVRDVRVGALARLRLGVLYAERGRCREASALLDEALTGFGEDGDTAARVRARAWLADCALRLGEPGRAALEYARAAAEARSGDDSRPGAPDDLVAAARSLHARARRVRAGGGDVSADGPWPGLRALPETSGPWGRYRGDVYGER